MVILNIEPIIEWLTQWIVVECTGLGLIAGGLIMVLICCGILAECCGILAEFVNDNIIQWLLNISLGMLAIGVVVSLIGLVGGEITKAETGRYKYEAFLEEGHSVEELTEKYVVKEQKGLIFVIEDRKD